jgi:hypothetical protein
MRRFALLLVLGALPTLASGESVYRCQVGGKVAYSDRPCATGDERRIRTDGGPTEEDLAQARNRIDREIQSRKAKIAAEERDWQLRQQAYEQHLQREAAAKLSKPNPADDVKVLVGTQSGWEQKAQGQLRAEAEARATGNTPAPTGAAWEKDRQLTHTQSGWEKRTGRDRVQSVADVARMPSSPVPDPTPAPTPNPPSHITDTTGKIWINSGGGFVRDPKTNRTCDHFGNVIKCN